MDKAFSFEKEFEQFENNSKIQDQIISILQSRDPKLFGRWVANEEDQKKGIDLVVYKEFTLFHVDVKGVSHAKNHHYLEDISIELVGNYRYWLNTSGKEGRSWLFKANYETHYLLYYWLDKNGDVLPGILLILYNDLRKWAEKYFKFHEFQTFLSLDNIKDNIFHQKKRSLKLGNFKGFPIWSARNYDEKTGYCYFTINTPVKIDYLNREFNELNLRSITKWFKK